jgi:hypothetical protein
MTPSTYIYSTSFLLAFVNDKCDNYLQQFTLTLIIGWNVQLLVSECKTDRWVLIFHRNMKFLLCLPP